MIPQMREGSGSGHLGIWWASGVGLRVLQHSLPLPALPQLLVGPTPERESAALPFSPVGFSQVTASGQLRGRQLPGGGARPQAGRTDAFCFSMFPASCTAGNRGSVLLEVQKLPQLHGEGSYDQQIPKSSFPLDAAKAATPPRPPALPMLVTQGSVGSSSACWGLQGQP